MAFPSKSSRLLPEQLLSFLEKTPKHIRQIKILRFFFAKLICLSITVASVTAFLLVLMENDLEKTAAYISTVFFIFFLSTLGILVAVLLKCYLEPRITLSFVQSICSLVDIYNEDSRDLVAHVNYDNEFEKLSVEINFVETQSPEQGKFVPRAILNSPEDDDDYNDSLREDEKELEEIPEGKLDDGEELEIEI